MFRTEIPLTPLSQQLPPSARVLTLGSCFSDSIGARLTEFKVATLVNPFGTVFNPISACKLLRAAAGEDVDWQQHLVEARGRWQSYDLHAEIGADSPVELLQHISRLTREVGVFLATADVVVLTLGSAYAYRLHETGELISNCHKIPAEQFDKELLTADDIIAAVAETHAYLRRINPKLRFILTVSPVRHLKDTLVLNSASKAMLRVACHYLSELLPDVTYFPAYELLLDDLRDYRFYATDMLHLSESAENYVWEKFTRTYFDAAFGRFKKEWEGIRQSLNHRPLHPAAPEHRAFLESTLERLRKLSGTADVRMELLHVERELASLPKPKPTAPVEEEQYDDGEERIDIGSFDDQVAVDQAQPVAVAPIVGAVTDSAPKKDAGKPETGQKEVSRAAVFAKTRLTSQASLLRAGAGLLVEDAEETEPEEADTETDEATVSGDSAYDHAYAPTPTDLMDEAEAGEDAADDSTEANPEETVEEAARRKKRRSRGGVKRTKRKHARLAAEQAAVEGQAETSAVATAPAPLPDMLLPAATDSGEASGAERAGSADEPASEVVYVTEAELRQPHPTTDEPAAGEPEAEQTPSETDGVAPATRRSRNNRRGNKREQAPRYGGRPGRQPLYAVDAESGAAPIEPEASPITEAATESIAEVVTPTFAPVESVTPAPVQATDATSAATDTNAPSAADNAPVDMAKPSVRKRPARAKAPKSTATEPAAAPAVAPPAESSPDTPITAGPTAIAPAATEATPAKPARRRPAAKAKAAAVTAEPAAATAESATAVVTPVAPMATEPESAPEPAKAPTRKRASAKPKAAAAEPTAQAQTAEPPAETATPEPVAAPPKKPAKAKAAPKAAAKPTAKKAAARSKPVATAPEGATDTPATPTKPPAKPRKPAAKAPKKADPEVPES